MATLILSTVGTALGGPVGGALGSIVGQALDQSLFGPPTRRGPRLGDLRVQTSSYGTPIPRIYGRMRVAGTVVWATDLIEEEVVAGGGKGAPGAISYSYSASFAVALSSRQAGSVGRIWADGKLLRGADGKFKAKTKYRFHSGSEDQAVDPLIAAVEGSAGSPAFRGLALAVFEDLALADYGNRIPSLTFELIADASPPTVAGIIADASRGTIETGSGPSTLLGYAAVGNDRRSAIEPLIDLWGGSYYDDGSRVRVLPDGGASIVLSETRALGCSADGDKVPAVAERRQEASDALPTVLTIEYYDPARDYQAGQMRASLAAGGRAQRRIDSAAALTAEAAKSLASDALARRWAGRDRLALRLSPAYLDLRPGQLIELVPHPGLYRIEQVSIEALVVIVDARRTHLGGATLAADAGRGNVDRDVSIGASVPLLIDAPSLSANDNLLSVLLAVGCSGAFRPTPVELSANGQPLGRRIVDRAAVIGEALGVLAPGQAQLIDRINSVDVQLVNAGALLFNADDDALAAGANAAMLGGEMVQFARAEALGAGKYRLSGLLRGRRGSEWAMAAHVVGERFVLLDEAAILAVPMDPAMVGASVEARAFGIADNEAAPPLAQAIAAGESLRPLSPCQLSGSVSAAGLTLGWVPRRTAAFGWIAGEDPDLAGARYLVTIARSAGSTVRDASVASLVLDAAALAALGSGVVSVSIVEINPNGASRPATISVTA